MLGRLSAAVQSAVDTIVPPVPLLEDFVYHWRMITKFYSHTSSNFREPIESTNVGAHVEQLMKILIEEETEEKCINDEQREPPLPAEDDISTGPCLEYLLEYRLLDVFATLTSTDQPIGMRTSCLEFFSRLLPHIRPPILPHVAIIGPVKKVVELCLQTKASPTEVEEVNFLCTLCAVMGKNPTLINVYMSINEETSGENTASDTSCETSTPKTSPTEEPSNRFYLCDALLNHLQSADYRVVLRACEGLMLLASLPFDSLAGTLVLSGLHEALPSRLALLFSSIPPDLDPNNLDDVHATWGLDSPQWTEGSKFPGCHQVAAFLAWLDYCDQMVRETHPCVGSALAVAIKQQFFKACIQALLYEADCGAAIILATAHLTKCVRMITAPSLLEELCHWLVGEESEYSDANGDGEPGNSVLQLLLDNCVHELDEVSLESLRLFEVLIDSQLEPVIHSLALKQLLSRGYCCNGKQRPSCRKGKRDEKKARRLALKNSKACDNSVKNEEVSATESTSLTLDNWSDKEPEEMLAVTSPGCLRLSKTLAPDNISEIIACFVNILPQQLRTSEPPNFSLENAESLTEEEIGSMGSFGYEQYIQEANRQYREVFMRCASYSWPSEAKFSESVPSSASSTPPHSPSPSPPSSSSPRPSSGAASDDSAELTSWDSRPEADFTSQFNEGPFLSMLIARLENLPYQAHEINLQATALVSRLALLPHPHLHEWLLNPLLKMAPGCHTVYLALRSAAHEMESRVPLIPDFHQKLDSTRKTLLGTSDNDAPSRIRLEEEEARTLESVIVLEEFCKELAAIAFVKYHYSS